MNDQSGSGNGASLLGGLGAAGILFLLALLGIWMLVYIYYGPQGSLSVQETTVIAAVLALLVFGGRWCILRFRRKARPVQTKVTEK